MALGTFSRMILALVEPCWAATRLPAMSSMPLMGLPFFTMNCAPVMKKVRLNSTLSRRWGVSVMVPAMRSTAFEVRSGMRVGGVDSFFSSLTGLPTFLATAGQHALLHQVDGEAHPLVVLVDVGEGGRAGARADGEDAGPGDLLQGRLGEGRGGAPGHEGEGEQQSAVRVS